MMSFFSQVDVINTLQHILLLHSIIQNLPLFVFCTIHLFFFCCFSLCLLFMIASVPVIHGCFVFSCSFCIDESPSWQEKYPCLQFQLKDFSSFTLPSNISIFSLFYWFTVRSIAKSRRGEHAELCTQLARHSFTITESLQILRLYNQTSLWVSLQGGKMYKFTYGFASWLLTICQCVCLGLSSCKRCKSCVFFYHRLLCHIPLLVFVNCLFGLWLKDPNTYRKVVSR